MTSTFSNPAGNAAEAAASYMRAMFDVLGDRDPLTVMDELVPWMDRRVRGLDDTVLRRPEAPGKWSVIEIAHHLADTELVYGYRVRIILTQDSPPIPGYDQDVWVRTLRYRESPLPEVLSQLAALRTMNLRLLRSLAPELSADRGARHSVEHDLGRHLRRRGAAFGLRAGARHRFTRRSPDGRHQRRANRPQQHPGAAKIARRMQ